MLTLLHPIWRFGLIAVLLNYPKKCSLFNIYFWLLTYDTFILLTQFEVRVEIRTVNYALDCLEVAIVVLAIGYATFSVMNRG